MTTTPDPDRHTAADEAAQILTPQPEAAGFAPAVANPAAAWAEIVGIIGFAFLSRYVCNQWALARMHPLRYGNTLQAALLPEICWALFVLVQAALLTRLRRSGLRSIGLRREDPVRQVLWGFAIGTAGLATSHLLRLAITYTVGIPPRPQAPHWMLNLPEPGFLVLSVAGAIGTATLYLGLLLPRLCRATRSAIVGVMLCALIQAAPYWTAHYDWRTIVCRVGVQLVTCALYLSARSLAAAVLGSVLFDVLGFVVMPRL